MARSWREFWTLVEDVSPRTFQARVTTHGVRGLLAPPSLPELVQAARDCADPGRRETLWAASRSLLAREREWAPNEGVAAALDREIELQGLLRAGPARLPAAA